MESTSEMGAAGLPLSSARRPVPADDEKQFASMARTDFGRWQIAMNMLISSGLEVNLTGQARTTGFHHITSTRPDVDGGALKIALAPVRMKRDEKVLHEYWAQRSNDSKTNEGFLFSEKPVAIDHA